MHSNSSGSYTRVVWHTRAAGWVTWTISAIFLFACTDVADLNDLRFTAGPSAGGGGDGAGGMAAGGAGGALPGVPAPDWTAAFGAVYLFEPAPQPIGFDSSGNGLELTAQAASARDAAEKMQGDSSLAANGSDHLESADAFFEPLGQDQLTVGGWFRVEATTGEVVFVHTGNGTPTGYQLERRVNNTLGCNGGGQAGNDGSDWIDGEWRHAVCTFDPIVGDMFGYLDGLRVITDLDGLGWQSTGIPLGVGGPGAAYAGQIDELFFIDRVLDEASIRRIYACGIDGLRCRCNADAPTQYELCGLQPACLALPPCDQAGP